MKSHRTRRQANLFLVLKDYREEPSAVRFQREWMGAPVCVPSEGGCVQHLLLIMRLHFLLNQNPVTQSYIYHSWHFWICAIIAIWILLSCKLPTPFVLRPPWQKEHTCRYPEEETVSSTNAATRGASVQVLLPLGANTQRRLIFSLNTWRSIRLAHSIKSIRKMLRMANWK